MTVLGIRPTARSCDPTAPTRLVIVPGTEATFTKAPTVRGYVTRRGTKTVTETVRKIVTRNVTRTEIVTRIAKRIAIETVGTIGLPVIGTDHRETGIGTEAEAAAITMTGAPRTTSHRKWGTGRSTSVRPAKSTITTASRRCLNGRSPETGSTGRKRKRGKNGISDIGGTETEIAIESTTGRHPTLRQAGPKTRTRMVRPRDIPVTVGQHRTAATGTRLPLRGRRRAETITGIISNLFRSRRSPEGTAMVKNF